MTGICCSRAEKTQKGQLQLADQPLMLLAARHQLRSFCL